MVALSILPYNFLPRIASTAMLKPKQKISKSQSENFLSGKLKSPLDIVLSFHTGT